MGPKTSTPERADAETLGKTLFDNETFQQWGDVYAINTFSIYFVTSAFLGLLDKGTQDVQGWSSSVINITSISGVIKMAQEHVRFPSFSLEINPSTVPVRVQQLQGSGVAPDEDDGYGIRVEGLGRPCERDSPWGMGFRDDI